MRTTTSTELTEHDEAAIREAVSRADAAQDDPEALLSLHAPEAVVVNFPGRRVLGREAFAAAMAQSLASPLREVRTSVDVVDVRLLTPDVAIVSCVKHVHDGRSGDADTSLPAATGALTYVMSRTADGWRIGLAQTTPVL